MIKNRIILTTIIIAIGFVSYLLLFPKDNLRKTEVCFNNSCFDVEIAETNKQKTKGLMYKEKLNENKGMLFVYGKEGIYSFWMKNTYIPLDIIWINKDKEVVYIKEDAQPCGQNECYNIQPTKHAQYVLELNSGTVERTNLSVGNIINFNNI